MKKRHQIPASLNPPSSLAPPRSCRGAITAWPQLLRAATRISADTESGAALRARYGTPFGGPQELMAALALHPTILMGSSPPTDMYAQVIQFANHVASAARTMGVTLAELPALAEATADLPKKQAGALVRGVVDGRGGLVETADHVAEMADDLLSRLGDSGRKEAFASFRDIGGELRRQASDVAATKAENLAVLQAEAESAGRRIRANLDKLELQAALVGVAAVMENLAAALKSMASAWRQAGQSMTKAMAAADAGQLSDPAYLKKALNLDAAVREWNGLADATRSFVQGSVTAI